jgi:hypothetical protein
LSTAQKGRKERETLEAAVTKCNRYYDESGVLVIVSRIRPYDLDELGLHHDPRVTESEAVRAKS